MTIDGNKVRSFFARRKLADAPFARCGVGRLVESLEQRRLFNTGFLNQSFENPTLSSGGYLYNPTSSQQGGGWTFSGTSGISANSSPFTGTLASPEGKQVAFIQNTGSINQTITLSSYEAGTYYVEFWASQRQSGNGGGQYLNVLANGKSGNTKIGPTNGYSYYESTSFYLSGNVTISIAGLNPLGGDNTALVDDVTIGTLINYNFEAPTLPSGGYVYDENDGIGWSYTGNSGITAANSPFSGTLMTTFPTDSQAAFIQTTGSISQSINTLQGGYYQLDFEASQRYSGNASYQQIAVQVGQVVVDTVTPESTVPGFIDYQTPTFYLSGVTTVKFSGLDPMGGDNTALVGALALITSSSTPPPSSVQASNTGTVVREPTPTSSNSVYMQADSAFSDSEITFFGNDNKTDIDTLFSER